MADYSISGARLQPIYERLNSAPRYHPIEAETFADWSMEAGDIVTITRDGQSYESPVQTSVVRWRKGQQVSVSSGGNQQRDAVSKVSQNKYSRASGGAGLRNSRHLGGSIEASYNELAAGLVVTASGIYTYAINQYTGLSSGLTQTASVITAFVNSRYDEMSAGLEITSSRISQYVEDRYRDMRAGLDITSSSFHAYVEDRYRDMRSGLNITSSSLHAYVRSRYEDMQAGLALTSSSAAIYTNGRTSRAYIMTRINASGESQAVISADVIDIDGLVSSLAVKNVVVNSLKAGSVQVTSSSGQTFVDVATVPYVDGSIYNLRIAADGTSGYKLQKRCLGDQGDWEDIPNTNFSRATSLTGAWSGNKCTVTASPQGATWSVGFTNDADSMISIDTNGAATATQLRKTISVPLRVIETKGTTQKNVYTKDQTVNAEIAWNNGWDDAKAKIAMPASGGTAETFTVKVPNTARNGQTDRLFKLVKPSTPGPTGYASVVLFPEGSDGSGNGNLVGRISIGDWYTAGQSAGGHNTPYRMRCAEIEYGSGGTKTVRFTIGYSATQSVPFTAGNDYTFYM